MNVPGLGRLVRQYAACPGGRAYYEFLRDHPDILTPESVALLEQLREAASAGGHQGAATRIEYARDLLEQCLAEGVGRVFNVDRHANEADNAASNSPASANRAVGLGSRHRSIASLRTRSASALSRVAM